MLPIPLRGEDIAGRHLGTARLRRCRGGIRFIYGSCLIMDFDPLLLSRIQFAFTISFHIIFPAFTIGLAAWLATLEALSLATGQDVYSRLFDLWLKIFAVAFGMGVVSGIVMAFQFGTNW